MKRILLTILLPLGLFAQQSHNAIHFDGIGKDKLLKNTNKRKIMFSLTNIKLCKTQLIISINYISKLFCVSNFENELKSFW